MNTAQLAAWFKANKVEVLGVGAAGVAGLALLQRKKSGTAGGTAGATAGAVAPGTIPAASIVPATADSSAFDAYNALQDEIGTLARQNEAAAQTGAGGSGVSAAVNPPIASTLYSPNYTGNYWRMGSGIGEIESDGSLYLFTPQQAAQANKTHPGVVTDLGKNVPGLKFFSTGRNLAAKNVAPAAAPAGAAGTT